uniref:MYND-type domain-containing protein n=1 Tax=Anopheles minimus TaxID=112268 RepID=A0A182W1A0_9DIPT
MDTKPYAPLYAVPAVECAMCKVLGAQYVCATCGTFYCNVPCQAKHWPSHKDVCLPRLVMATSLLGTACSLPVKPIPTKPSNEKLSSSNPKLQNGSPNSTTLKSCNDDVENKRPNNVHNKGNIVPQQTIVANGANTRKPPSNEEKAKQHKAKPVIKDGIDNNVKNSTVVVERRVEKSGQNSVSSVVDKPPSVVEKAEPISGSVSVHKVEKSIRKAIDSAAEKPPSAVDRAVPNSGSVSVQKVEKSIRKAIDFADEKPPANVEKAKQQLREPASKNVSSTTADGARKANEGGKHGPKPEGGTNAKLLQQGAFPEPGCMIKISYVADDKIYIYETGFGPNGERNGIEVLIKRTLECAQSVKGCLSVPPTVDDIVFASYDGDYYRAVVKSVENDRAEVFYADFGNSQMVKWNTLKEIPDPKIKYANCLTHCVWIENIASFTPSVKNFLQQLENEAEFLLITVIDVQNAAGVKMVELYHCSEKYYLSAKLRELQIAYPSVKKPLPPKPKSPEKASKWVITNPSTYKPVQIDELTDGSNIEEGKGIELVIVNASDAFTENRMCVATKQNYDLYKAMMEECEMYGKIDPNPYEPNEDEVCLVNTKGVWCRAVTIIAESTNTLMLYLVDECISVDDKDIEIRRFPPGMTRQQFGIDCVVENSNFLLKAIGGNENDVSKLCGKLIKADIQCSMDDDMDQSTHLTIVAVSK